jgi:hypothetical protein
VVIRRHGLPVVPRVRPLLLLVLLAALAVPATAGASTLAYQCGGAICAVDPDAGGSPRQVSADGRLAGLTRDGRTVSWVDATGIVQAPASGGAPRRVFTGEVVAQPSMSPDGSRYLYSYPGPDGLGGLNATWVNQVDVADGSVDSLSFCFFCVTSHGWMGDLSIAAFPVTERGAPSQVCRIATNEDVPGVGSSCVQALASDARGGIGFPTGNAAGTEIVAVLSEGQRTGIRGRIVRYSVATGAPTADVTTGSDDTTPVFSAEGDRVAFERAGRIVVKDLASGAERVIGAGVNPFWGGARSLPVRVSRTLRTRTLRAGAPVRVTCTRACRVSASLRVARSTARRLGTARTIAKASGERSRGGTATLRLKATRAAAARLGRASAYRATLRVTARPGGTVTVPLRVRR